MHDAQSRTPSSPQQAFVPLTGMPDEHKYSYTVNPWTIRDHDQKFFNSLIQIVGDLDDRERFIDAAGGSGRRLVAILISDAARASDKDRSLVSATFNEYVTAGLGGPFEKRKRSTFGGRNTRRCSASCPTTSVPTTTRRSRCFPT